MSSFYVVKENFFYHQEDARVDGESGMTGGKGLVGIDDGPGGDLGIRACVRNEVSAKKIRERHCFCYFPVTLDTD